MKKQLSLSPPTPPHVAPYEPADPNLPDEPVFEQAHLVDQLDWPEQVSAPWQFDSCKLERCSLVQRTLPTARIWDSVLVRCDLSGSECFGAGVLRSELLGCRASGLQLAESTIKDVSFQNCKLNMANFRKCKLERVVFENCILDEADFNDARLTDVAFIKCDLQRTSFHGSTSERVDMTLSDIGNMLGVQSLKNVRIKPEQMLDLAPLLCQEIGLIIAD